jgi:hypothetical protein
VTAALLLVSVSALALRNRECRRLRRAVQIVTSIAG